VTYNPNDWQEFLPDHAADAREAMMQHWLSSLNRIIADTDNSMLEAAATGIEHDTTFLPGIDDG
jgi:hypothetical protein